MSFIRDLMMGPGNKYWCIGRVAVGTGLLTTLGAVGWDVYLGQPIELGPTGLLGGLAAFYGGCAGLIWAKDSVAAGAPTSKE